MRKGRKRGAILPIVEYGKQVSDAVELERRTHGLLKRFRVRGEWFRCSVSTATNAILCVTMAADEAGACKTRDEWIEEQAQALIIIWRSVRYIPRAMRPSVGKFREEREKKVREGGAPRDRRRFYQPQPWRARTRRTNAARYVPASWRRNSFAKEVDEARGTLGWAPGRYAPFLIEAIHDRKGGSPRGLPSRER